MLESEGFERDRCTVGGESGARRVDRFVLDREVMAGGNVKYEHN